MFVETKKISKAKAKVWVRQIYGSDSVEKVVIKKKHTHVGPKPKPFDHKLQQRSNRKTVGHNSTTLLTKALTATTMAIGLSAQSSTKYKPEKKKNREHTIKLNK